MKKLYVSVIFTLLLCVASVREAKALGPYYYIGGGASITSLSSWSTSSLIATGAPTSFSGAVVWNFVGAQTLSLSTTWTVASNGVINFGDGTNVFTFYMKAGIGISTNSNTQPQLNIKGNCTFLSEFSQAFNVNKTNLATNSTFIYDTGSPADIVVTTSGYYNLIINNSIDLNNGSPAVVNGTLTINSGKTLALGGSPITFNAVAGSGEFIGDNGSNAIITITGSGTNSVNFQSGSRLVGGLVSTGTGTIVLTNDLSIDGASAGSGLSLTSGALDLNGHALTFDNAAVADFGSGTIIGSSSSSLLFNDASGGLSGSLQMASGANTLKALYLNASGQTLTLGNSLNIADSISAADGTIATGGNLTLLATSALKGRVGMMGSTGAISGNATVQTFAPGPTTGWAQLGINGVTGNAIGSWDGQFPITCTGCTYDPSSLSPHFFSIQGWDESDPTAYCYDTTVTSSTALTPGKGFWVYLGTGASTTSDITYVNTGSLVQGVVTVAITAHETTGDDGTDNYNLIANPYASPVSWNKIYALGSQGLNLSSPSITIWNADTGEQTLNPNDGEVIIPAGQGFYVQGAHFFDFSMTFDESVKTADNTSANPLMRTSATAQSFNVSGFKLNVTGDNGDFDNTVFRFNAAATTNYDHLYDANKMFSTPGYMGTASVYDHYTSISSISPNHKYAINTLPVITGSLSVPVLVRVSATGVYSISVSDIKNYSSCTILKDNLTGTYHDLGVSPYVCTISDTTSAPRFEMVVCEVSSPTSVKQLNAESNSIQVIQDAEGPFVTTHFEQNTKATISVFNVVGQQLIKDLQIEGTDTKTRLNVNSHNEMLLIQVTSDKATVTKKIITH